MLRSDIPTILEENLRVEGEVVCGDIGFLHSSEIPADHGSLVKVCAVTEKELFVTTSLHDDSSGDAIRIPHESFIKIWDDLLIGSFTRTKGPNSKVVIVSNYHVSDENKLWYVVEDVDNGGYSDCEESDLLEGWEILPEGTIVRVNGNDLSVEDELLRVVGKVSDTLYILSRPDCDSVCSFNNGYSTIVVSVSQITPFFHFGADDPFWKGDPFWGDDLLLFT